MRLYSKGVLTELVTLLKVSERLGGDTAPELGHLYFVLRDAEGEDETNESVFNALFYDDGNNTRNEQRHIIRRAFRSLEVVCLCPAASFEAMRSDSFSFADCSPLFQDQIVLMRRSIARKMSEQPRTLQGMLLTGVTIAETVNTVVEALNSGVTNVFEPGAARAIQERILQTACEAAKADVRRIIAEKLQTPCDPDAFLATLGSALDAVVIGFHQQEVLNPVMFREWLALLQAYITEQSAVGAEQNSVAVKGAVVTAVVRDVRLEELVRDFTANVQQCVYQEEGDLVAAWDAELTIRLTMLREWAYGYMRIQYEANEWAVYKEVHHNLTQALTTALAQLQIVLLRLNNQEFQRKLQSKMDLFDLEVIALRHQFDLTVQNLELRIGQQQVTY